MAAHEFPLTAGEIFHYEPYPRGHKSMQFRVMPRPHGWKQWRRALWGADVFFGPVPFFKSTVFVNAAVLLAVWLVK